MKKKLVSILICILLFFSVLSGLTIHVQADDNWWDINWSYRKLITINSSLTDEDLTNFPVLISTADNDLKNNAQLDGDDIVFVLYNDNTTQLNHETEEYDDGELITWINIPSLSSSVDTKIWMYYGNPTCDNQEHSEDVWDDNYILIQHLEESSGTLYDSTSNDNDGTKHGDANQTNNGYLSKGFSFDGDGDFISLPDDVLDSHTTGTVCAWIKPSGSNGLTILGFGDSSGDSRKIWMWHKYSDFWVRIRTLGSWNQIVWRTYNNAGPADVWSYVCFRQNGTNVSIFVNGELAPTIVDVYGSTQYSDWFSTIGADCENVDIGQMDDGSASDYFNGTIDEVRISKIARSEAWIKTSYNTMNTPRPEELAAEPRADVNRDGQVTGGDFGVIANPANWGKIIGSDDPPANPLADVNEDGIVDDLDSEVVTKPGNWGKLTNLYLSFGDEELLRFEDVPLYQLVINAPLSVTEEVTIEFAVTANGNPIEGVEVTFNDNTSYSDDSGIVVFTAPKVEEDTDFNIEASKEEYLPTTAAITIKNRQLVISTNSTVIEESNFTITIKREDTDEAIKGANVTFNGYINQTDQSGQVIFTAPEVDESSYYEIFVTHEDYSPATASIFILNEIEAGAEEVGHLWGKITDNSGDPVENVNICFQLYDDESIDCLYYSNKDGQYVASIPPGVYTVEVKKNGYTKITENPVVIQKNIADEKNFRLEISSDQTENEFDATEDSKILARVEVTYDKYEVAKYTDDITISHEISDDKDEVMFIINNKEEKEGVVGFFFPDDSIVNIDEKIGIKVNDNEIFQATSLDYLLSHPDENSYYIGNGFIVVNVLETDVSSITIYQIVGIGIVLALSIYVIVCVVGVWAFIYDIFEDTVHFRRKKKR